MFQLIFSSQNYSGLVNISPNDSILTLKNEISKLFSYPIHLQKLFYGVKELDDLREVCDYGLGNFSTVTISLGLKGGAANCLTPAMMPLFAARPQLDFWKVEQHKKLPSYSGLSAYLNAFNENPDPLAGVKLENKAERTARIQKLRKEENENKIQENLAKWDPHHDPSIQGNAYKTLFVARLSYETNEHRLKREFESYGPIRRVRLVRHHATNKSRGYAFIEYESESDMKHAYKHGDGKKIDDRRVCVDVERGRTVKNWRPRRLGGGLGNTRAARLPGTNKKKKPSEPAGLFSRDSDRRRESSRDDRRSSSHHEPERQRSRSERDKERDTRDSRDNRDSRDKSERDRGERERSEREKGEREKGEREKGERERSERDRGERERSERERGERERGERERGERERGERERSERERSEKDRGREKDGKDSRDRERGERDHGSSHRGDERRRH